MLKYKRVVIDEVYDARETIISILSGMSGKDRRIVSISTAPLANHWLRVYRDAEQIVDCSTIVMTTAAPLLLMDLPLADGQECKVGFYNNGVATAAKAITIGYTETG